MENPNPIIVSEKKKPYLGIFGLIKSAIEIPLSSSTYFFFIFLTSFPLFLAMLFPKLPFSVLPSSLLEMPFLATKIDLIDDGAQFLNIIIRLLNDCLIDIIRFILAITTVHSASKIILTTKIAGSVTLQNLVENSITKAKLNGPNITFLLMSVFSSASLDAATYWGGSGPLVRSRTIIFHVVHGITYAAVMVVWCHYRALWRVGLVISILEGNKIGFEAFKASADLIKGNKTRGIILMVLDMAWRLSSGLPTLFWGLSSGVAIAYDVVDAYLMCFGRVMNWVVLVVYYYDCKNRERGNQKMVVEKDGASKLVNSTDESKI